MFKSKNNPINDARPKEQNKIVLEEEHVVDYNKINNALSKKQELYDQLCKENNDKI